MGRPIVATYSIAACDLETGQWGVATQSKFLAVGSVVPWAEPHVGAIATQAYANPRYGPDGLALLREGLSAEEVVARLTAADADRNHRQLGVVDGQGGSASYTGSECMDWAGGKAGPCFAAQGNILVGAETVDALASTFEASARQAARRAPDRLPRRRAGSRRRPARPAVRRAPGRGEGRRLREPHRRPRRPARRRPPRSDHRARAALPPARPAVRQDPARQLARGRRRAARRAGRAARSARVHG